MFWLIAEVTSPINAARIFAAFCNSFSQREKVYMNRKPQAFAKTKILRESLLLIRKLLIRHKFALQ
jgi:hypothetical protein